jgi:hypothetical protein
VKYNTPYDPTNRGALFKAGFKKTDKSPDYLGTLNVEGKAWSIFGRKAIAEKTGKAYLQLSVAPPLEKDQKPEPPADPFEDDVF